MEVQEKNLNRLEESPTSPPKEIIDIVCEFLSSGEATALPTVAEHVCSVLGVNEYRKQLQRQKLSKYLSGKSDRVRIVDHMIRLTTPEELEEERKTTEDNNATTSLPPTAPQPERRAPRARVANNKDDDIIVPCPHCEHSIIVARRAIRCGVFRHGVYKANGRPIPPHSKRELCEQLVAEDKVYGCAKPFRITVNKLQEPWKYTTEVCGYI